MGNRTPLIFALTLLLSSVGVGQTLLLPIPDDLPAVGACNVIPFGSASNTYVARIPASFMDPSRTDVRDVAFAPCYTGIFRANACKIALGHVPSPLPTPFTFPVIAGGVVVSLGSFLDLVVMHDSDVMGPFQWAYNQDMWSPMGYASRNGTGFLWNSINDLGFFVTHQGATGSSPMHSTITEPFRVYKSGAYQAPVSVGSGPNGLKMRLGVATYVPPMPSLAMIGTGCVGSSGLPMMLSSLELPAIGNAQFSLEISQGPPGSIAYLYLATGIAPYAVIVGPGCDFYLELASWQYLLALGVSPIGPLGLGASGATSFWLPVPADPGIAGLRLAFQAAAVDASGPFGLVLSNAADCIVH